MSFKACVARERWDVYLSFDALLLKLGFQWQPEKTNGEKKGASFYTEAEALAYARGCECGHLIPRIEVVLEPAPEIPLTVVRGTHND